MGDTAHETPARIVRAMKGLPCDCALPQDVKRRLHTKQTTHARYAGKPVLDFKSTHCSTHTHTHMYKHPAMCIALASKRPHLVCFCCQRVELHIAVHHGVIAMVVQQVDQATQGINGLFHRVLGEKIMSGINTGGERECVRTCVSVVTCVCVCCFLCTGGNTWHCIPPGGNNLLTHSCTRKK